MAQIFVNGIEGLLSAPLVLDGSVMSGTFLAAIPEVTGGDYVVLTIDPDEVYADAEIVHVTGHSASAQTATITRENEGTTQPASWPTGTKVVASWTAASVQGLVTATSSAAADATAALSAASLMPADRVRSVALQDLWLFFHDSTGSGSSSTPPKTFTKPSGWGTYDVTAYALIDAWLSNDPPDGATGRISFTGHSGWISAGSVQPQDNQTKSVLLTASAGSFSGDGTIKITLTKAGSLASVQVDTIFYGVTLLRTS